MKKETVYVGVSGGVDSSVALLRLLDAGYNVVAVFIRTWQPHFIECTWKRERLDAMRVAAHLNVPFLTFDAELTYKEKVADYMIQEYREGRTPNPDIMCNAYVKFGVFYDFARARGADFIATGHYAQIQKQGSAYELHRGVDTDKDQSYFLARIKAEQLPHILFPVGDTPKSSIRAEALRAGLITSSKKDSQGICFLGQIDMYDFLKEFIELEDGDVLDTEGNKIGRHKGALIYTVGQRQGFTVHTHTDHSTPHYVISRELSANTITVHNVPPYCTNVKVTLTNINLFVDTLPTECEAQFRYRQKPFRVQVQMTDSGHAMLTVLTEGADLPSQGQSCVLYNGTRCLGGGIIDDIV